MIFHDRNTSTVTKLSKIANYRLMKVANVFSTWTSLFAKNLPMPFLDGLLYKNAQIKEEGNDYGENRHIIVPLISRQNSVLPVIFRGTCKAHTKT